MDTTNAAASHEALAAVEKYCSKPNAAITRAVTYALLDLATAIREHGR